MESTQVSGVPVLEAGLGSRETNIPAIWLAQQGAGGMSGYAGMQK